MLELQEWFRRKDRKVGLLEMGREDGRGWSQ